MKAIDASQDCLYVTFLCRGELEKGDNRPPLLILASRGVRQAASREVVLAVEDFAEYWVKNMVEAFLSESHQAQRLDSNAMVAANPRSNEAYSLRFANRFPVDFGSYLESLSTTTWCSHPDFQMWYNANLQDIYEDSRSVTNTRSNPFSLSEASYNLVPAADLKPPKTNVDRSNLPFIHAEKATTRYATIPAQEPSPSSSDSSSTTSSDSSKVTPTATQPQAVIYRHRSSTFGSSAPTPKKMSLEESR